MVESVFGPSAGLDLGFRPSHADEQEWHEGGPRCDAGDHLEQRRLGPLGVIEDDDEWLVRRDMLEELAETPGDLLLGERRLGEAHRGRDTVGDRRGIGRTMR